jgi:hypothetical protein
MSDTIVTADTPPTTIELAIARALVNSPRLLVLDEPTEGRAPVMVDRLVLTPGLPSSIMACIGGRSTSDAQPTRRLTRITRRTRVQYARPVARADHTLAPIKAATIVSLAAPRHCCLLPRFKRFQQSRKVSAQCQRRQTCPTARAYPVWW